MIDENEEQQQPVSVMNDIAEAFGQKDQTSGVQAIKEIFNAENLKMKTEIDEKSGQESNYSDCYLLSDWLGIPELRKDCDLNLELSISKGRKGRREAVEISRQSVEPPKNRGLFGGLFG